MSNYICKGCQTAIRRGLRSSRPLSARKYSSEAAPKAPLDIAALLSKPTWSVRSLVPSDSTPPSAEITPQKLHHLLRLSALPLPKSPEEEASMLATLHSQLHFVRDIQNVDTEGVEPLQSLRDETEEGIEDITIGLETLREALGKEDIKGRNRRPKRRRGEEVDTKGVEDWNVTKTASEKVKTPGGKFFIVRSGKGDTEEP
ncbi:hypothetical protein ONS95_007303 [Cadophora gregata]|uniref:uncharacterized protein n=1 Tax=Cadophora gregata TaxID=51156 RepID=UPI0026DCAE33|nr:uncharacterized protein ONS95_007303 [Cadophora gregata]KAK0100856.1 hypothetical protein ONS95_007303 [Cadophora gregata]KAK0117151.1 hypothetical protein ONS96_012985 [Cadophora gregata f. sp. sojae]